MGLGTDSLSGLIPNTTGDWLKKQPAFASAHQIGSGEDVIDLRMPAAYPEWHGTEPALPRLTCATRGVD